VGFLRSKAKITRPQSSPRRAPVWGLLLTILATMMTWFGFLGWVAWKALSWATA
jgi:hypothetical protein